VPTHARAQVIEAFASMSPAEAQRFMAEKFNAPLRIGIAKLVNGRTLCDVGCGKAFMVDYLYQKAYYLGVDVSAELLAVAQANNPGYEFRLHDMAKLRFPVWDSYFDCSLMISVLEHVDDLDVARRIYNEAMRISKELLVVWHTPPIYETTELIRVDCELDRPINQNHYARGSFDREDLEVRSERVAGFECWRVSRRRGFPTDYR